MHERMRNSRLRKKLKKIWLWFSFFIGCFVWL
jgi:hypothetical protein